MKSECSHCGTNKTRKCPHHTQEYKHSPNSYYTHTPSYHRTATLPSHNLHMSSPPVIIQHTPIPCSYIQSCHECVPAPQLHHCHQQHQCSPCHMHKEESRFNQEFESLKDFIREEIRSGWTKSPRSRRAKPYSSSREYTVSETDSEDPYLLSGQSKGTYPSKSYKLWKNQDTESTHSLAATHSLQSKRSEVSSILEDELFMKLVSNPAKYSYELQEIAKLLTSPPASRASSTSSRQTLRTIKHLVRDAICSYSTSELESSDTNEEGPLTEESEGNLSRLEYVSSRTIYKARKAKEMKSEVTITPKPSILKTSSRLIDQGIDPCISLTGLKRVNFSSETINIDDGQPTQLNNIPDDYVVVGEDEISLAGQEIREAEQTTANNIQESQSANSKIELAVKSSAHLAYPYDQYMAGELADPYTIVQNEDQSVSASCSRASQRGRADAASRILSELGMESDTNIKLSYSHSLELKASLHSIPSYVSEAESRNSIGIRPNRPALESNTGVADDTHPSRLLSNSRASLKEVVPQREGEDELEIEKRANSQGITTRNVETICDDEMTDSVNIEPVQPPRRRNSLTLREYDSRRKSMTQFSRISLVSKPSFQVNEQQEQALSEEVVSVNQPVEKTEKQTSKSSLASRIFSSFTSLVSLKPSASKSSVIEQGSNKSIHSDVSNMSLSSKTADSVSRTGPKQEDIQKAASSVSRTTSKQEYIHKASSSVSNIASKQDEIQKASSSVSRTASKREDIQKAASSVGRTASKQEDISAMQDELTSANTDNSSPQCECTDCPDPTECTDCTHTAPTPEQTNTGSRVDPILSSEAPVKIVLSPEVVARVEENEADMGVVMTFSEEWKIICTKDCPSGVEETTITDWRDHDVETDPLAVSESAPTLCASSEIKSQDLQTGRKSLDSIELDTTELSSKDNIKSEETTPPTEESSATQQQLDTSSNKGETIVTQDNHTTSPIVIEDSPAGVSSLKGEEIPSEATVEEKELLVNTYDEQNVPYISTDIVSNETADKEDILQKINTPDDIVESKDGISSLTDNIEVVTDPVEANEAIEVIDNSHDNPPGNTEINEKIKPSNSGEDESISTNTNIFNEHTADNMTEGEITEKESNYLSQNETEDKLTNPDHSSPNTSLPPETNQA
ncbi:hypothetical protein LOD99_2799 [Oopsacas minuta]|uniref:Uncharacterized protein n=1 Tax=Oopsacas minuta TaxID=111878 RepID=A0AAV7K2C0_9METZ|nr:hypothetical protein LOD99_2799 [Oopsacas minuta]